AIVRRRIRCAASSKRAVLPTSSPSATLTPSPTPTVVAPTATPVPPDTTPPRVQPTLRPAPSASGWNNGQVVVTWSTDDPESGVNSTEGCSSRHGGSARHLY